MFTSSAFGGLRYLVLSATAAAGASGLWRSTPPTPGHLRSTHSAAVASAARFDPATLSGEHLFAGIFLGQGTAAAVLPELWSPRALSLTASPRSAAAARDVVEHIRSQHPEFFEDFRRAVVSGDPLRVRSALTSGAAHLRTLPSRGTDVSRRAGTDYVVSYVFDYSLSTMLEPAIVYVVGDGRVAQGGPHTVAPLGLDVAVRSIVLHLTAAGA